MTPSGSGNAPLVAIVTPVLNGGRFLAEALDAVQAQTYPNLVHIVHDNASTDETPEILARYANARVRVEVASNEYTVPIGANWNAAVRRVPADAKYFRVLCADDLIEPEYIEHTVDLGERNPSVVVVGCGLRHRTADATKTQWDRDREVFGGQEAAQRFFLGKGLIIAHQTLMRCVLLDHVPFFDEGLIASDTDACLRCFRRGDWGFVHVVLATSRDHSETYSRTVTEKMMMHSCEYLAFLERHAEFAFGSVEGRRFMQRYRRYYFRQLLRWRMGGMRGVFDRHVTAIEKWSSGPRIWQFLDAIADWPLARLGLRPIWVGYPF